MINIDLCLNRDNLDSSKYYIKNKDNIEINEKLWNIFKKNYGYDIEINSKKKKENHRIIELEFRDTPNFILIKFY